MALWTDPYFTGLVTPVHRADSSKVNRQSRPDTASSTASPSGPAIRSCPTGIGSRSGSSSTAASRRLARVRHNRPDQRHTPAFAERRRETRVSRPDVVRHADRRLVRYGLAERPNAAFGAVLRRCDVKRTFAWLGQARRPGRRYERRPATSEAMIDSAMTPLLARRLTRAAADYTRCGRVHVASTRCHSRSRSPGGTAGRAPAM